MTMKRTVLALLSGIVQAVIPSIALGTIACSAAHSLTASLHGSTSSSSSSRSGSSSSDSSSSDSPSSMPTASQREQAEAEKSKAMDDENFRLTMKEIAEEMPGLAPDPGRDKAPVRPAPWCRAVKLKRNEYRPRTVAVEYELAKRDGFSKLIRAAALSCLWAKPPEMQVAASMIEQDWINLTGLSEPDAVESIAARIDADAWKADRQKLCSALTASKEDQGEDKAFTETRRALFGCPNDEPQWGEMRAPPDELLAFLDQSDAPPDELMRLSWLLARTKGGVDDDAQGDHRILSYVTDAYDFRALSPAAALKVLEAPPYAGNLYARVVVKESIGRARIQMATYEEAVKKRIKDPGWNELLVKAPQRAIEAYTASAARFKAEIARSNAFEHKVLGPSKRAAAGCEAQLRRDFLNVYRKLPHATDNEAKDSLSDPVASLLFRRLLVCMNIDGNDDLASDLTSQLLTQSRRSRGPRIAAYYGSLEALGKIKADRERFPIDAAALRAHGGSQDVLGNPAGGSSFPIEEKGVVKTVHKAADGLHIKFERSAHQEMTSSCTPTNRIVQIRSDGTVQYYMNCHDTGLITVNDTPAEIAIATELAEGIAPGMLMHFRVRLQSRGAYPMTVYTDKRKTKLVNYYGFGL
jgi:hypothetical protein